MTQSGAGNVASTPAGSQSPTPTEITTTTSDAPVSVNTAAGGPSSAGASPTSVGPKGPIPAGLDRYYRQKLGWTSCLSYATTSDDAQYYAGPDLTCARVTVPLDYRRPDGATVTVGLLRKAATGRNPIGSVVFDPGGPGGSGMSIVAQIAYADLDPTLNSRFDLVGFDPRGVGSSEPSVKCGTDADKDADRVANSFGDPPIGTPSDVDAVNQRTKHYVTSCLDHSGSNGITGRDFLASVGTVTVAKDLDVVRAVLGDAKLTYVGWSYGTSIGTQYAEQFPTNVRALLLDGDMDPEIGFAVSDVQQMAGFQQAFDAFAKDCESQYRCPLGKDPSRATAVFQRLVRPLLTHPMKLADGRTLSYLDAVLGTTYALYSDASWPDLRSALLDLDAGQGASLMTLSDYYNERDGNGHYSPDYDAYNAIRCMDNDRITDPAAQQQHLRAVDAVAPYLDDGQPPVAVFDVCTYWPIKPTMTPHVPDPKGLPTVLVISTTEDPATPYIGGVKLAKDLGARLLTVRGTRHGAYMLERVPCADVLGNLYLTDLTLPPVGTTCS